MKYPLILLLSLSLSACISNKSKTLDRADDDLPNTDLYDPLESEVSSAEENYQAALDFLNGYIESIDQLEILEYVNNSPLASENLKKALEDIVIRAWEEHPRIGLDFDPLFDAQDYPAEGVELQYFNPETGYVTAKGIGWEDFRVVMKVISDDGHILVDGCGAVNIPIDKRAER